MTVVFFLTRLSGDPARLMAPPDAMEEVAVIRENLGLNKPLPVQYVDYMKNALKGDFGVSYHHKQSAMEMVLDRLPKTAYLSALAHLIALCVAIPLVP